MGTSLRLSLKKLGVRFIIGDIKGLKTIIELVHGKLRTPKNIRFNLLIDLLKETKNFSKP